MFEISGIGVVTAFMAGLVSFLSPCVLPLVPGYISYITGQSIDDIQAQGISRQKLYALIMSLCFVFGFSLVFISFGAGATVIGRYLVAYQREANTVAGIIIILFGLFLTGVIPIHRLQREFRLHFDIGRGGHPVSSFVLGIAFAFGWTPCIGPILGAILTLGAAQSTVGSGIALLTIYSIGLGVPFILTTLFIEHFMEYSKRIRRYTRTIHVFSGVVMILMGIAIITGYLQSFSYWLLEMIPWFGTIG